MLKCALIGPGRMGVNYAKVIQQNPSAELIAICGNSVETTKRNATFLNLPLYFNNQWDKMFSDFPEINTVFISTSEWAHLAPFEAAVKNGKNIIIEKPIGISPKEYESMEKLVKAHPQIKVMVCHTCRFDQRFIHAKQLLDAGGIGEVSYIYCRRNADIKTAARVMGKIPMSYWITAHDIDLLRWYLTSEVAEVYACTSKRSDHFLIVNLLFKNGVRALVETVWLGEPIVGQQHSRMDIEGKNGKIEINISSPSVVQFSSENTTLVDEHDFIEVYGNYTGTTPNMVNHFIEVLSKGKKAAVDFNDGLAAVKVCEAIHQSIISNNLIKL